MEETIGEKNERYSLPLHQKARFRILHHLLFGFIEAVFLAFILIPGNDQEKIKLNIAFLLFFVFFGYLWLAGGFFKRPILTVTDEYLEYKWLFGHKTIKLCDIYAIEFYSEKAFVKMGIKAKENGKLSFWDITDRMLGRDYSVSIVVSIFPNIDFNKLYLTLLEKPN